MGEVAPEDILTTTAFSAEATTSEEFDTGTTLPPFTGTMPPIDPSMLRGMLPPIDPRLRGGLPIGVLQNADGSSARKRCRCIEKKHRKVVKEIKYIPLMPVVHLAGNHRKNFTCKCSHLRKIAKNN